jgi:hypothetical protein
MSVARSEMHSLSDKMMVLSTQIERATVIIDRVESNMDENIERLEKSIDHHRQQLDIIHDKFVKQEATLEAFYKVAKFKPLWFLIGCALMVVLSDGAADILHHMMNK